MTLHGQVALVTGAGRGIGKAIAMKLASEGVNVGLVARTAADLNAVAAQLKEAYGVRTHTVAADISNRREVEQAVQQTTEALGPIDILINNAGAAKFGTVLDMDPADWEQILRVNVLGTYYVTRAVLPDMVRRNTGSIVNVSSTAGQRGAATTSAYSAAKFGVIGFSESLMQEVRKHNIRVTTLTPSTVNTEMATTLGLKIGPQDRMLQPEDVADLVWSILNLPQRVFVNQAGIWTTNPA
ncbi:MAG: 3-ketoacyl-ACP reductase [Alicyclobacillus sp.]|nr:3-ketoacyl-ACP reductase [Alicyclobacillus sp.]